MDGIDPLEQGPDPDAILLQGEPEMLRQQQEEEEYEAELAEAAAAAASAKKVICFCIDVTQEGHEVGWGGGSAGVQRARWRRRQRP